MIGDKIDNISEDSSYVRGVRSSQTIPLKLLTLSGHLSNIKSVNYSPDGSRIVSGACDRTLRVWNAIDGALIMTLDGSSGSPGCVFTAEYNHDGTRIVSGSSDNIIRMWNALDGGSPIFSIELDADIKSIGFNHDGTRIVSATRALAQIWDARAGYSILTLSGHTEIVKVVKYSPDGRYVASGSEDDTIKIWDAINGGPAIRTLIGHVADLRSIAFSPDGSRLASASNDSTIKIWDPINGGNALMTLSGGHTNDIWSVVFSPDGSKVASSGWDSTVNIWDARTGGKTIFTLEEKDIGDVISLDFSPDGTRLAFGSDNYEIEVWEVFARENSSPTLSPVLSPTSPPVYTYPAPSKITGTTPMSPGLTPFFENISELQTSIDSSNQGMSAIEISAMAFISVLFSIALVVVFIYTRKKPEKLVKSSETGMNIAVDDKSFT